MDSKSELHFHPWCINLSLNLCCFLPHVTDVIKLVSNISPVNLCSGGFRGGGGEARGHGPGPRAFHAQKGPRTFTLPPPPQCICQNVQKYSVRCLKVVPGVPKMVLIRSKSKKYPPISSKAACKICPKVIPDGPKMA